MPKLLFVGIVERACRATVVREIPGITDCFQVKDTSQKGKEPEISVRHHLFAGLTWPHGVYLGAHNKRIQSAWNVGIRFWL